MEEQPAMSESSAKRRKTIDEDSGVSDGAAGVVIWDIDDTIVVIQASLKFSYKAYQRELVETVKDYLTAYLEKEFYFSDTLHMKVVERLSDWDEEKSPSSTPSKPAECGLKIERHIRTLLHASASDITARGSTYSTYLKSHYHSFQKPTSTTNTDENTIDTNNTNNTEITENTDTIQLKLPFKNSIQIYERLPPGWKGVFEAMESRTFLWTKQARAVLSHLKKKNVRNMIVTASELAPAVAKLIMWGLCEFFDINDIYSSANKPKTTVFLNLLKDLGANNNPPQFVAACGDGPDEERAALNFSIPFQKITSPLDLYAVPALLHKDFAMEIPEEYCTLNPLKTAHSSTLNSTHNSGVKVTLNPTLKPTPIATPMAELPLKPIPMSETPLKSVNPEIVEIPETLEIAESLKALGGEETILPSDAKPESMLPSNSTSLIIDIPSIPIAPMILVMNGQDSVIKIDRELFLDCHKKLITYTSSISRSHMIIETNTEKGQEQFDNSQS